MSAAEMAEYYRQVHRDAIRRDSRDLLAPVIHPSGHPWVNRFTDYAHRLGMQRAYRYLESEYGSLDGLQVLDVGCGRGRWSREYAWRGAQVTGVDISEDAIAILRDEMPGHRFICGDLASLSFPGSFDVVNSVTVLQHMPENQQQTALGLIHFWLKPGGHLVLLENVVAFDAPHVFPHRPEEWVRLAQQTGLKCVANWGSNFESLFRVWSAVLQRVGHRQSGSHMEDWKPPNAPSAMRDRLRAVVALLSYPVEWCCHGLPLTAATHTVFIFCKK
jgi:SAM-dependent methyltransferase